MGEHVDLCEHVDKTGPLLRHGRRGALTSCIISDTPNKGAVMRCLAVGPDRERERKGRGEKEHRKKV